MKCNICAHSTEFVFSATVLGKIDAPFYRCLHCGFLQTEEPTWLDEAYAIPIIPYDTGIMMRNYRLSMQTASLLFYQFKPGNKFVDFGGGYGIFTRLMRDIGFDFYWYDPYAQNLIAQGFNYEQSMQGIELVTCFESFEHFVSPLEEIERILQISRNLLISTELLPEPIPGPGEWWYYMFDHGQHISFYTVRTLNEIARRFGLNLYTYKNVHLFTEKVISPFFFRLLVKYCTKGIYKRVVNKMNSRTYSDIDEIKAISLMSQ